MGDEFSDMQAGKLMQEVHTLSIAMQDLVVSLKSLQVEIKENRARVYTVENKMNRWFGFSAGAMASLSFVGIALGLMIKLDII